MLLHLIRKKIQNKKILNICLLIGIVLMVGITSSTPMFQNGSLNRLIQDKMDDYVRNYNEVPIVFSREDELKLDAEPTYDAVADKLDDYYNTWSENMEVPVKDSQRHVWLFPGEVNRQYGINKEYLKVSYLENVDEHIDIMKGQTLEEYRNGADASVIPCYITEKIMDTTGYVVGEELTAAQFKAKTGLPLKLVIAGVINESDNSDSYWFERLDSFDNELLISKDDMAKIVSEYPIKKLFYTQHMIFDYTEVNNRNIKGIGECISSIKEQDELFTENASDILNDYENDRQFISIIFFVLEVPVFALLLAFIYMVSGQILEMESAEISMFKSRGFSPFQIIKMYILQSSILAVIGSVIGILLGVVICKIVASATGFLQFSIKDVSMYKPVIEIVYYTLASTVCVVLFMTIPALPYTFNTITMQKSKQSENKKSFIYKYYLDVILLVISSYLLFNYSRQRDMIALDVLMGRKLDPIIFLNLSLFLLACGFVGVRLIKYLVILIFKLIQKRMKVHTYASFLQIVRTGGKRDFISIFLIFTISMGIVDANIAGTVNKNNDLRTNYNVGCDICIKEQWAPKKYMDTINRKYVFYYQEPDYERFDNIIGNDCESMTRVIKEEDVKVYNKKNIPGCTLMGINTKEFGETAKLPDGLNEDHWYNYLNELSKTSNGIIVSSNIADTLNLKVGDELRYERKDTINGKNATPIASNGLIVAIVDAWPGYNRYYYEYEEDKLVEKENYLVVDNYAYEVSIMGQLPYEVWCKSDKSISETSLSNLLYDNGISCEYVTCAKDEVERYNNSAMVQIMNGLFSLSFLVSIILCTIGFLIYWITSIKQRELLFGIYRAMGMSMKEVSSMLFNEQFFSSFIACIFGGLTGICATYLFTKLIATVYLPKSHNIPLMIAFDTSDFIRLICIVIIMIIVVLMVLKNMLHKSSITSAIKMGED